MARIFVRPADGLIVRDPNTKQLVDPAGFEVDEFDLGWVRKIRDGDVVVVDQAAPALAPKEKPAPSLPAPAPAAAAADAPPAASEADQ
ncbi:MAG TPA: DUF2635 domain-containing protein [Caulobacteraceae bacterium]|nr:DUF2635 domain-containing protein [Caulobacteraceae bacterium]